MINIVHKFICDICGKVYEDKYQYKMGWNTVKVYLPIGWKVVGDKLVCPKHKARTIKYHEENGKIKYNLMDVAKVTEIKKWSERKEGK